MINQATRILTRWLREHPTYSVRERADALAFDSEAEEERLKIGGESLPLTIYNDVDDPCVAERYDPDVTPALVIVAELATEAGVKRGRGQLDYDQLRVSFAYMESETPVNDARQRGGYILTAAMDALLAFNEPTLSRVPIPTLDPVASFAETSATWRALGAVEVLEVSDLRESRVTGGVGKSMLIGTLLGTFKVRRTVPVRYPVG